MIDVKNKQAWVIFSLEDTQQIPEESIVETESDTKNSIKKQVLFQNNKEIREIIDLEEGESFYSERILEQDCEDDIISAEEEGFMKGFLA